MREKDMFVLACSLFDGSIGIDRMIQRPSLNRRWSQNTILKTYPKLIHDFRDRGTCKLYGIDTHQALKIVIEVDQAKLDPPVADARDCYLATTESKRLQACFEHRAANGVEYQVSALPVRDSFHGKGKLLGLGVYKEVNVGALVGNVTPDNFCLLPVRDLCRAPADRAKGTSNQNGLTRLDI